MNNENDIDMGAVRINITLPEDTFSKLEKYCKEEDRSRSNVIKRLIDTYIKSKN